MYATPPRKRFRSPETLFDSPYEWPTNLSDAQKDEKLRSYRKRLNRFDEMVKAKDKDHENLTKDKEMLKNENEKLKDELKEKAIRLEESEKIKNGISKYVKTMTERTASVSNEKNEALKKVDGLQKQLNDKEKVIESLKDSHNEKVKSLEATVNKFKAESEGLQTKLSEKESEMNESPQIECLKNEVEAIKNRAKKYKDKYDAIFKDFNKIKAENRELKLRPSSDSVRGQRDYFQKNNENNKRKYLGATASLIKTKQLYRDAVTTVGKKSLELTESLFVELMEFFEKKKLEKRRELLEGMAETVVEVREGNKKIEEQEKRIIEKRADGRVQCGSCEQTFSTTGYLSQHMTVRHNIHTQDRSKNHNVDVITIE